MTEASNSATQWLRVARKSWLAWGGVACYMVASPFLALITWSAGQVWLGGMAHALDASGVQGIAAVALARQHPLPFAVFGAVSLVVAFVGGLLLHRAVGQIAPEAEGI
ncbi:MAG: hypothetical protein H0X24_13780 [Ktedonobacterales bacterium]|nr:hypothetical protein [Ktedonobacterales bacterium]